MTIHKIMVEEYVPKRDAFNPFIVSMIGIILLYLYDLIVGMYE